MKKAHELIQEIEKKRKNWDERSQFKIKGVGNLSCSDLDTIELYAETYLQSGNLSALMRPLGGIAQVLKAYGIE